MPTEAQTTPEPPQGPENGSQAPQQAHPGPKKITLTATRDLVSRAASLQKRYAALITALNELGIEDGVIASGLRGQLVGAHNALRLGASHVDEATTIINEVNQTLEDL